VSTCRTENHQHHTSPADDKPEFVWRVSWSRIIALTRADEKGAKVMSKKGGNKSKAPAKKPVMENKGPKKK